MVEIYDPVDENVATTFYSNLTFNVRYLSSFLIEYVDNSHSKFFIEVTLFSIYVPMYYFYTKWFSFSPSGMKTWYV